MRIVLRLALLAGATLPLSAMAQSGYPAGLLPPGYQVNSGKANCTPSGRLDPNSQNPCDWFMLALAHQKGLYVPKDHPRSLDYLMRAARAGHATAAKGLSEAYQSGFGGLQADPRGALHWMVVAATMKDPEAIFNVGVMLEDGVGTEPNPVRAAERYQEAVDHGFWQATATLGNLYFEGRGVPRNVERAVQLWQLGADNGSFQAQAALGDAYRMGEGVPFDTQQARYWLRKAQAGGSTYAPKVLAYMDQVDRKYGGRYQTGTVGGAQGNRIYAGNVSARSSTSPSGPSLSDQAMAAHRRQYQENCAAADKGANRQCVRY